MHVRQTEPCMQHKVEFEFHGRPFSIEVGRLAKQASGSALVTCGETVVLATVVGSDTAREGVDFLPLTVDYQEKTFAAGKIPGGFFKREGRPAEREILTSRLIDRPLRPRFPKGWRCETQVIATVLSADRENESDMPALVGASAALEVSDVPFDGPIAAVRVGRRDGRFVVNPLISELAECDVQLVVAGCKGGIVMVEGGAKMVPEDVILDALFTGQEALAPLLAAQDELREKLGKPKRDVAAPPPRDEALAARVDSVARPRIEAALGRREKMERQQATREATRAVVAELAGEFPERERELFACIDDLKREYVRGRIVSERARVDGRGLADIRPISCEVQVLPRTHGSAVFTRGETQALAVTTLGTSSDEQKIDALIGESYKKFMLHYNFPPFSVGEAKFLRGPARREIGHGALAERALLPSLPAEEDFPYTIRLVSEVLESNGSSSMATVCGGSLALMDAGVPVKGAVAGVAMGLIKEGEEIRVLSDILGDEDHLGDMDFKVAGTREGVTAVQMDNKIGSLTKEIMHEALLQARAGRLHILDEMARAIAEPRGDLSMHAPRIVTIKIKPDRIRDVIGPGGKVIRSIIEETGAKIDVEDDGTVFIASSDGDAMQRAVDRIKGITAEAEPGRIYNGTVRKIVDFGAFVEILPGTDGLLHISQIGPGRVARVTDVLKEGDQIPVKVLEVDRQGKIRLSRKEAMAEQEQGARDGGGRQER
jgi:polyribonucleotide nucleotidyltransferase